MEYPRMKSQIDYSFFDELIEEAEMYCIVHEIKVDLDERFGYSIVWPNGCWLLCSQYYFSKQEATEMAAIFAFLWFKHCSPPIACDLAYAYVACAKINRERGGE